MILERISLENFLFFSQSEKNVYFHENALKFLFAGGMIPIVIII